MWPKHIESTEITLTLPKRNAEELAPVPDLSRYVHALLIWRQHEVHVAARVMLRAGWSSAEVCAAAVACARYYGGPPTELVDPRLRTVRAVSFGSEHEDVVARFALDADAWSARVQSLTDERLARAVETLGAELSNGAGLELLRNRVDELLR